MVTEKSSNGVAGRAKEHIENRASMITENPSSGVAGPVNSTGGLAGRSLAFQNSATAREYAGRSVSGLEKMVNEGDATAWVGTFETYREFNIDTTLRNKTNLINNPLLRRCAYKIEGDGESTDPPGGRTRTDGRARSSDAQKSETSRHTKRSFGIRDLRQLSESL